MNGEATRLWKMIMMPSIMLGVQLKGKIHPNCYFYISNHARVSCLPGYSVGQGIFFLSSLSLFFIH